MHRLARRYHGLFHLAHATIHDRWVKRFRLVAFLAASSIATQVVLRNVLGYVGLSNLVPSSILTILVASVIWLVAYPAMWLRMLAVMAEMEAKKSSTRCFTRLRICTSGNRNHGNDTLSRAGALVDRPGDPES